ncbi:MAG TPA: acyl-CoA dehydrogenase family protein [Methylomirabilota bacterium]|nr:acyl-CoA dehydrogenase family protein [Methylomirabilota bacterium]
MDFAWNEEQEALRAAIVKFARQELNGSLIERDAAGEFAWEEWKKCGEFGIQGLPVPAKYGGGGSDALTIVAALEALGYGCADNGLIFSINAHMWGAEISIASYGSEEQKRRLLPRLASGEFIGGHAMTEPVSGSDAYSLETRAERRGDRYVLNGQKVFITNAPVADVIIIFATLDRSRGASGISAFIVEKETPGFTVGRKMSKMGLRTSPMGEVFLDECEIPAEHLLGQEGMGTAIFSTSMEWERTCILASQLGTMQRLLETSAEYSKGRKQFGKPIGRFQAVSGKIAEMDVRLETARLVLYKAAWLKQQGKRAPREASIAKLYVSEACVASCLDAMQIHGGYGYMTEFQIERELRDALAGRIYSGTSEIQKLIISGLRGLSGE